MSQHLSFILVGKAAEESQGQNRTREIRPSGIAGGLTETWVMGVGLRPTGKPVDEPADPKAVRAVFLYRLRGEGRAISIPTTTTFSITDVPIFEPVF